MALRLPPPNTLRIFDAAARHGSFKLAAEELHLTASAVSHGMQTLESWLGAELFHRGVRSLSLTPAGKVYAPLVSQALMTLAEATGQLPGRRATGELSVSSAPHFARRWLIPRLSRFAEQFPDTRVTIDTSEALGTGPLGGADIAIRAAEVPRPGARWIRLITESLVPVCAPSFKQQLEDMDEAAMLVRGPHIRVTSATSDWQEWLRATRTEIPANIDNGLRVDSVQMAIDAAIEGLGLALGRRPLVDDDIKNGRLVCLSNLTVPTGSSFWMGCVEENFERPEVKLFRHWVQTELKG